ncbi:TPA: alpha-1,2-fucosyltransferase [Photobacterium damselae]
MNNCKVFAQGGLGNQMFQYAFYKNVELLYSDRKVSFDMGRVVVDNQHKGVSLSSLFNSDDVLYSKNKDLPLLIKDSYLSRVLRKILRKFNVRNSKFGFYDFDAKSSFNDVNLSHENYIGYFQFVESALFCKNIIEDQIYKNNESLINDYKIRFYDKVGLHIRRGDFLGSNDANHQVASLSYIEQAISHVVTEVVVFSDDIEWCKKNLPKSSRITFFEGNSAIEDFLALSQCKDYILSGSTFSWWAAFIFSNAHTQIIIPLNHKAQFMSEYSNQKLEWNVKCI